MAMMAMFMHLKCAHKEVLLGYLVIIKHRHHLRHNCISQLIYCMHQQMTALKRIFAQEEQMGVESKRADRKNLPRPGG